MTDQEKSKSIRVEEARAAVQASGQLEALDGPVYMAEAGDEWLPYFSRTLYGADAHPEFAKVTITRKGQAPREIVISWEEYASDLQLNDPEWNETRQQKPMTIFGSEAERHSYRVVFADVLAPLLSQPRTVEVERYTHAEPEILTVWDPPRSWLAEVASADAVTLKALYDEAREAEALVGVEGLQAAFTERQIALATVPKVEPKPAGPTPAIMPSRKPEPPRPQGQGNRRRRGKR